MTSGSPSSVARLSRILSITLIGGFLAGGGAYLLKQRIQSDLHKDLTWTRYYAPIERSSRADQWFPLTYPLFQRWSNSPDPIRQRYALDAITRRGLPYTRWWLEDQLKQNPPGYNSLPAALQSGYDTVKQESTPPQFAAFGLDQPDPAKALIRLALQHWDPKREGQFNEQFLQALSSSEVFPYREILWFELLAKAKASPETAKSLANLFPYDWKGVPASIATEAKALQAKLNVDSPVQSYGDAESKQLNELSDPTPEQVLALLNKLDPNAQQWLIRDAGNAETLTPGGRILLKTLASDPQSPHRVLAAAYLLTKSDPEGIAILKSAAEDDFKQLYSIQDYLLLLRIANTFPNSRYARACRDYATIRGGTYFGDGRVFDLNQRSNAPFPPAEEEVRWREWLKTYPDHPGADDASYWLGRTLEWQGKRSQALKQFADLLTDPVGDQDVQYQIRDRFLMLLDVSTNSEDLEEFLKDYPQHLLKNLVTYALAVRKARQHDYQSALDLTQSLPLDKILNQYPGYRPPYYYDTALQKGQLDQQLAQQRQRWQSLLPNASLQTPQQRYQLAAAWADPTGWQNGYLWLYEENRGGGGYGDSLYPASFQPQLARNYALANHNAVALDLLEPLLAEGQTLELQEKSRYLQVALLYRQFVSYPPSETEAMSPLPNFPPGVGSDSKLYKVPVDPNADPKDPYQRAYRQSLEKNAWYIRQAIYATNQLLKQFPQSRYGDDSLFALYEMTGESEYLKRIIAEFPQGDRQEEAQAALFMAISAPK